ncbi:hypothetical protein DEO72_LG3g1982 [Vigna unguiculata]|uniref:Uncharacterized protein n=1 Tax=Vigna unguiculata TaxID=3917 RepID=A0A4D6LGA9_VIGUN|nr:hypothetical protein DEO72_LG3g1982 [Vigna unguiculata]
MRLSLLDQDVDIHFNVFRNGCQHVRLHLGEVPLQHRSRCSSPLFSPYITCASNDTDDQLFLKTHSVVTYPITSISYATSTLTLAPSSMSSCSAIHPAITNFTLDWTSPFQLSSTTFFLLSCHPALSLSSPFYDPSFDYLCATLYTCPVITSLDLPLFPPTNSCCVYIPSPTSMPTASLTSKPCSVGPTLL